MESLCLCSILRVVSMKILFWNKNEIKPCSFLSLTLYNEENKNVGK